MAPLYPALPSIEQILGAPRPSSSTLSVAAIMLFFMPICLGLALWSMRLQKERSHAARCFLIMAFAVSATAIALSMYLASDTQVDVLAESNPDFDHYRHILQTLLAAEILCILGLALSKLSVLFLYRTIFPTHVMRTGTLLLGAFICVWAITLTFLLIFTCNPPSAFWDAPRLLASGESLQCLDHLKVYAYSIVPNVVADIVILILPIREVVRLQMPQVKQLKVIGVFTLGTIVTVVAIIRLTLVISPKTFFESIPFRVAELGLSLICACFPILGPALNKIFGLRDVPHGSQLLPSDPRRMAASDTTPPPTQTPAGFWRRISQKIKTAVGWAPLPEVDLDAMNNPAPPAVNMRNLSMHSEGESSRFKSHAASHLDSAQPHPNSHKFRNSAEMEEFRRLYEYSGRNPFSYDAYAQMPDSELFGGIRVEQRVEWKVEENVPDPRVSNEGSAGESAVQMPARAYDGGEYRSREPPI